MKKSLFIAGIATATLFTACNINNDPEPIPDPVQSKIGLLQHKWDVQTKLVVYQFPPNPIDSVNFPVGANDYYDFKTDGKVHSLIQDSLFINDYQLINNDSILLQGSGYTITKLDEINFNLYFITAYPNGGWRKDILELKR